MEINQFPVRIIYDSLATSFMVMAEKDARFRRFIISGMDIGDIPVVVMPRQNKQGPIIATCHLSDQALELYYQYKEQAEKS